MEVISNYESSHKRVYVLINTADYNGEYGVKVVSIEEKEFYDSMEDNVFGWGMENLSDMKVGQMINADWEGAYVMRIA